MSAATPKSAPFVPATTRAGKPCKLCLKKGSICKKHEKLAPKVPRPRAYFYARAHIIHTRTGTHTLTRTHTDPFDGA